MLLSKQKCTARTHTHTATIKRAKALDIKRVKKKDDLRAHLPMTVDPHTEKEKTSGSQQASSESRHSLRLSAFTLLPKLCVC